MNNYRIKNFYRTKINRILLIILTLGIIFTDIDPVFAEKNPYAVEVGKYGMTPVYGRDVKDGTYDIAVDSNSTFFKVVHASITVAGDKITGSIEIGSHSYLHCFLGTKEQAKEAAEKDFIEPEEKGDSYIFTFPVEALDKPLDCAAFSKKKSRWYDRKILFDATTLPEGALEIELPDYDAIEHGLKAIEIINGESSDGDNSEMGANSETGASGNTYGGAEGDAYFKTEAMEVPYEDGEYSIEVSMAGGTGRVTISSPTLMIVKDGRAYAKILMSSSRYDWMIAGGEKYLNENTNGGNSYFIIPIPAMDSLVHIIANTTAMGDPVAIEYTLTFYADTIGNKGQIPQEAAKKVLIAAIIIIVVGGVLNYFVKKKKRRVRK